MRWELKGLLFGILVCVSGWGNVVEFSQEKYSWTKVKCSSQSGVNYSDRAANLILTTEGEEENHPQSKARLRLEILNFRSLWENASEKGKMEVTLDDATVGSIAFTTRQGETWGSAQLRGMRSECKLTITKQADHWIAISGNCKSLVDKSVNSGPVTGLKLDGVSPFQCPVPYQ